MHKTADLLMEYFVNLIFSTCITNLSIGLAGSCCIGYIEQEIFHYAYTLYIVIYMELYMYVYINVH